MSGERAKRGLDHPSFLRKSGLAAGGVAGIAAMSPFASLAQEGRAVWSDRSTWNSSNGGRRIPHQEVRTSQARRVPRSGAGALPLFNSSSQPALSFPLCTSIRPRERRGPRAFSAWDLVSMSRW
jgi:hypothetical protein